jgi:asparagine synthase (glutamine-hydrolysing)
MAKQDTLSKNQAISYAAGTASGLAAWSLNGIHGLYQGDGLIAALCGKPSFNDIETEARAHREGKARVLADAYRERGKEMLASIGGPFALAVVDERHHRALLAIDRMGIYPLIYLVLPRGLVFGTTTDAINAHPLVKHEVSPQGIFNYVFFHMVPGPGTIYRGQVRLLPGQWLELENDRVTSGKYWEVGYYEYSHHSFADLRDEFRELLRNGVHAAARGNAVGTFLSGGTDSSTVAGMLGGLSGKPVRTYSIGFNAEGYDEMEYARIAAQHFGTDHHEYYLTPDDVAEAIPDIGRAYDQPFGNSSAVPTYYCARLAKEDGITTLLGGDGGDELFGGNARYAKQYTFSLYEKLPVSLRKWMIEPAISALPMGKKMPLVRKIWSYIEQASVPMPARTETYNLLQRIGPHHLFTADFLSQVDPKEPFNLLDEVYHHARARSLINKMLALDLKFTLADNDLPKVTRSCELAGVNVEFPMLNDAMVAFSTRLAPQLKLKGTKLRYFFKEALRGFLPEAILSKEKHGFGLPFGLWLRTHKGLKELAQDNLGDLRRRGFVHEAFINELLDQRTADHAAYYGTLVWILIMLEQWFKHHVD